MKFNEWLAAKGFDPAALNETQTAALKAAFDAEQAPAPAVKPAVQAEQPERKLDTILAEVKREQERERQITAAADDAIKHQPHMAEEIGRMARAAIDDRTQSAKDFELELLRATRAPAGVIKTKDAKLQGQVLEAALCMSGGLEESACEKVFGDRTLQASRDQFKYGLGLRDVLILAAQANGHRGHFTSGQEYELLRAAFQPEVRAQGWSTISLPNIFANVANKFLAAGFNAVEDTWRMISAKKSVKDFKATSTNALTGGFTYEEVGPGGELKHALVSELNYVNQAKTYGRMFAITRQDIINDDLGALTAIPQKLGRGAALKLNSVFWTAFLDNSSFFTSGNTNYIEGATAGTNDSRLSDGTNALVEGLTRGETTFLNQTDPDGDPLGIMPKFLLVPNALYVPANALMSSTSLVTGASITAPSANPHSGKYQVVRSSYLSNTSYTGYSTTAWYLIADPADLPVIEVAFLNGKEIPTVESAEADFNTLGVQFRGYHDFGVTKQEKRAGMKSKGAA